MAMIRIRDRNQLTVPADIAAAAGLGPGSVCHMEFVNGVITITPAHAPPARSLEQFAGSCRGVWGASDEQIVLAIGDDRDSWQR